MPEAPRDPVTRALRRAVERATAAELPELSAPVRFEVRRKVLHVVVAVVAVPLLLVVPFWVLALLSALGVAVIAATWAIERRRLPRTLAGPLHEELAHVLASTRRPGEDFPWSPVLYTTSLVLIGLAHERLGLSWALAFAAYAILGIGDAASALVGVAYGRRRLPWNAKKSVEGTAAGLAAGFLAGAALGAVPYAVAGLAVPLAFFPVALAGATVGALAETLPCVEDNFVVPLASAAAMLALSTAIGLPVP